MDYRVVTRTAGIKKLRSEPNGAVLIDELALSRHEVYRVGNTTRTLGVPSDMGEILGVYYQSAQKLAVT